MLVSLVASENLSPFHLYRSVANEVWKILSVCAEVAPGIDLLVYCLSNGGLFLFNELVSRLGSDGKVCAADLNYKGLIADSAPAYMNPTTIARAMNDGKDSAFFYCIGTVINWLDPRYWTKEWEVQLNRDLRVPEMYLYSTGDQVTIADKVTELIEYRKSKGNEVISELFEDSKHVSHYKLYPEQYTQALDKFFQHVL